MAFGESGASLPMCAAGESGGSGDPGAAPAPRVLIVEDEYLIALEIEAALADAGFATVGMAATAAEAVRLARETHPELIVMDVRLPGDRDGVEAAIEIYRTSGIRCIFATAYGDPDLRRRAEPARPLGWLPKPYRMDALVRLIRNCLKERRQ